MIYTLNLQTVGLVVGAALVISHGFALWRAGETKRLLREFPRSRAAGTALMAAAAIWSFWLIRTMDLGEFAHLRHLMLAAIVVGAVLAWFYVEEFLAVRALGMVALLAADPLLEAAFLQPETSRWLLTVLAYAWIVLGLFWVGMPWTLRDQISWVTAQASRYRAAAAAGVIYGAAMLAVAVFFWK